MTSEILIDGYYSYTL